MAALSPSPILKFFKSDGITPNAGGKLYTYVTASTTPYTAYTNAAGTLAANPVILDSNGEVVIYLDTSVTYRFTIKDSADVLIRTVDDIKSQPSIAGTTDISDNSITTAKLVANAITFAKMQNLTGISLIGKSTAGSGVPEQLSISSDLSISGTTLQKTTTESVTSLTISAGAVAIDLSLNNYRTLSLTANVTAISFSNVPAATRAVTIVVRIAQDATGGRTIAGWPASVKWSGGAFTPSAAANAIDMVTLTTHDQGTSYLGSYLKAFA